MRAMLARVSPVEARPVNSSMVFGGCPAASTRTGDSINSAMAFSAYVTLRRRIGPERIALRPDCDSSKARADAPGARPSPGVSCDPEKQLRFAQGDSAFRLEGSPRRM